MYQLIFNYLKSFGYSNQSAAEYIKEYMPHLEE